MGIEQQGGSIVEKILDVGDIGEKRKLPGHPITLRNRAYHEENFLLPGGINLQTNFGMLVHGNRELLGQCWECTRIRIQEKVEPYCFGRFFQQLLDVFIDVIITRIISLELYIY